ncbi:MAG: hypothetical protein JO218_06920 [Burkholderiales bacterium]|nr:hypothetical protein [Burkholderiales bacterium]
MTSETKRNIIDALKKIIEIFKTDGKLAPDASYKSITYDPRELYRFIKAYRANPELAAGLVKDADGNPVTDEEATLVCGVSLLQIQQLLVKTCARHYLEQENKEPPRVVTETVKKKVFGGLFTKTEQVERKVAGGFDERKVREISKCMAFDWQLPLLPAYNMLNSAHLLELGETIHGLTTFEAIRDFIQLDHPTLRKAKQTVGDDFPNFLARPAALAGVGVWTKDMYQFYRKILGESAFDFFARDKQFFNVCAELDRPLAEIYGDVLSYIDGDNLQEMMRLNIDKADVLVQAMKASFGPAIKPALGNPNFAKDMLRKVVESLQHVSQEKAQLAQSAMITCKALAPQVAEWVERQQRSVA